MEDENDYEPTLKEGQVYLDHLTKEREGGWYEFHPVECASGLKLGPNWKPVSGHVTGDDELKHIERHERLMKEKRAKDA